MNRRRVTFAALLFVLFAIFLSGCATSEPILGHWITTNTTGSDSIFEFDYYDDGTFYSIRSSGDKTSASEEGVWEKFETMPKVKADEKEWSVYVVVPTDRLIDENTPEYQNKEKYTYYDGAAELYVLACDYKTIYIRGYQTLEQIQEAGTIDQSLEEVLATGRK